MTSVILPNALAGLAGGLAGGSPSIPSVLVTVLSVPPMTPITNALPDIPRSYTAICEWAACMVYIAVSYRHVPLRRSIIVSAAGLASLVAVQYFDGSMPIWFWIIGMLLAFACMYATILLGAGTGKREGLYITARAFVLAELVASLHWQIVTFIGVRDGFTDYDWRAIALLVVTYALCFGLAWMVERGNFSQATPTLADRFRRDCDDGHHDRHVRHEQFEFRVDEYAVFRFGRPGNLLHSHAGRFLRFRDPICAAGAGAPY